MENGDYKNDPMKRLVYKHDVIVALAARINEPIDFVEALKDLPVVDAVKVRHGHWLLDSSGAEFCSECGEYPFDDGEYHISGWSSNYCPNCGAKMDGGENKHE